MIIIAIRIEKPTEIINADLNHDFALSTFPAHKFCATKVDNAKDRFMIGIIANVSTLEAAVYQAITLSQNQFITACTANAHTATKDWFNMAGIAIQVISFNNVQSKRFSNGCVCIFFNLRNNTYKERPVAITRADTVANATHLIHKWNFKTNNKSSHIFTMADMMRNHNGVFESHNALNVDVTISYTNNNVVPKKITCRYCFAHSKIVSGVCNRLNKGPHKKYQIALTIKPTTQAEINAVYADFFTSFIFWAPKSWDIITLAHVANPIGIEINKKNTGNAAHTEAKAVSETNLQFRGHDKCF